MDELMSIFSKFLPQIVLTHWHDDCHPEHRKIFELCSYSILKVWINTSFPKALFSRMAELLFSEKPESVMHIDIEDYYSSINKETLYNMLSKSGIDEKTILLIKASFFHCDFGIPTGNCLSPMLSDFYLTPIDELFTSKYARFSDDLFISLESVDSPNLILNKLAPVLKILDLQINKDKCKIHFNPILSELL